MIAELSNAGDDVAFDCGSQAAVVEERDVLGLIAAGGNIYYLAKLAGIWGLNVQQLGAAQTGMSVEEFKAMLVAQGRQERTAA